MNFDFMHSYRDGRILPPWERYAAIREAGPLFWNDALQGWVAAGYAQVKGVLTRSKDFLNSESPQRAAFGHDAMLFHDGSLHNRLRAAWAAELLPEGIAQRKKQLDSLARQRTAPVLAALRSGESVDLVPVFQDYTTDVITAFMDVPDDRRSDFQRWNAIMTSTSQLALAPDDPRHIERNDAKQETYAYLDEQILDREKRLGRGEQPGDLVTLMVRSQGEKGIDRSAVADNLLNLFIGALDTTVRWMGNIVAGLIGHPAALAEIAARPELASTGFEEILRHQSVVQVTTRHVGPGGAELNGTRLEPGRLVYVLPGLANRDPDIFPEPDRFDIHRGQDGLRMHLSFGFGMHQCLGMHAARAEVLSFFQPLLASLPDWRIVEAEYGESWTLWGPTRLVVASRAAEI